MLDKPEFLTGEVKAFEEYFIAFMDDVSAHRHIQSFYLQPFEQEMIGKYFEDIGNTISLGRHGLELYTIYSTHLYFALPLPKTLCQFISDCIRAGIKLEWRLK